jgi:hypothetical protein
MNNFKIRTKAVFLLILPFLIFSCTEEPIDGEDGSDGLNGSSGLNSLITITDVAAGDDCSNGGYLIEVGLDDNSNGSLDANEIDASSFLCNNASGQGGMSANQIMVVTVEEAPGENCADGGIRFLIGYDQNEDGTLDTEEVIDVSFVCNGEDGQGTESGGRTYVILRGDITKEEARIKLDQEVGFLTQFVWVFDAVNIDSLVLPQVTELVELKVTGNSLKYLSLENLTTVYEVVELESDQLKYANLSSLNPGGFVGIMSANPIDSVLLNNFSNGLSVEAEIRYLNIENFSSGSLNLRGIFDDIIFPASSASEQLSITISNDDDSREYNLELPFRTAEYISVSGSVNVSFPFLESVDLDLSYGGSGAVIFPNLTSCPEVGFFGANLTSISIPQLENSSIRISDNTILESINLNGLTTGDVSVSRNPILNVISLSTLENGGIEINDNSQLENIVFNSFNSGGLYISDNSSLQTVDIPTLTEVSLEIRGNSVLSSINLNGVVTSGSISIRENPVLESVFLNSLQSISNRLDIVENALLSTIALPEIMSFNNLPGEIINLGQNNLSEVTLNTLLVHFDSINLNGVSTIFLNNSVFPGSEPSGAGLVALQSLRAKGIGVAVNQSF